MTSCFREIRHGPLNGVNAVEQPDDFGLRAASLPDPLTRVRIGRWYLVQGTGTNAPSR